MNLRPTFVALSPVPSLAPSAASDWNPLVGPWLDPGPDSWPWACLGLSMELVIATLDYPSHPPALCTLVGEGIAWAVVTLISQLIPCCGAALLLLLPNKNFFLTRTAKQWSRLPRELVQSSSSKLFQNRLDEALTGLPSPCFEEELGLDGVLRVPPT